MYTQDFLCPILLASSSVFVNLFDSLGKAQKAWAVRIVEKASSAKELDRE